MLILLHFNFLSAYNHHVCISRDESLSNTIVFVLSHSNETAHKSLEPFDNFSWAQPYILPRTYYFETHFYSHIMRDLMQSINMNADWIGSVSWKADTKANITVMAMMISDTTLTRHYDLLAFWNPVPTKTLWEQAAIHSPLFLDLLKYTLLSMGESQHHINMMRMKQPFFKTFYGSYFVTRPQHMRKYIHWISRVVQFLETDRKAQNMLWRNSGYEGDLKVARLVYDLPFYPMHPFLGERLVQYFFNSRGAKMLTAEEYLEQKKRKIKRKLNWIG